MTRVIKGRRQDSLIWLTGAFILAVLVLVSAPQFAYAETEDGSPVVVSLGDSYSSGEGNDPFYSQDSDDKANIEDWYAHRSELSWPGRLVVDGVQLSTVKDETWFFYATSGAVTTNVYSSEQSITVMPSVAYSSTDKPVGVQITSAVNALSEKGFSGENVDYVTITIGGNDMGFTDVLTETATYSSYISPSYLNDLIQKTWDTYYSEVESNLKECYEAIRKNFGNANVIVVGYPTLLASSDSSSVLYSQKEAAAINEQVNKFNDEISYLLSVYDDFYYVSVEDLFSGHEAYADDAYIYKLQWGPRSQEVNYKTAVSARSMHPNTQDDDDGAAVTSADGVNSGVTAYAWAVQQKIDELEAAESSDEVDADTSGSEADAAVDSETDADAEMASSCDVAMVLDVSGSMDGEPIEDLQTAALSFLDVVLDNDGTQVSITSFSYEATTLAGLTTSAAALKTGVEGLTATDSTNIEDGLRNAAALLDESESETQCIVLMSDGEPNEGLVGDELIAYAESIRDPDGDGADEVIIYALGFNVGSDAQYLLESIASDYCYYSVDDDVDTLENFFSDIGYQIAGTKFFYVEVACPVDVTVTYDGETLSSADDDLQTRTSFGSLSFKDAEVDEDGEDGDSGGADEVKVLRLMEGATYDIEIEGTDDGTMTYTVAFADDYGLYTDTRTFSDIDVEDGTIATSSVERADTTYLAVDVDGDGKIDALYGAGANEEGEMMDNSDVMFAFFVISGAVVVLFVLIGALLLLRALLRPTARAA